MNEAYQLKVPQMGEGLRFVKVVRALKTVGEWVDEDTDVVEVETEKAVLSISSPVRGYISSIRCQAGETVSVGATLLEITDLLSDKAEGIVDVSLHRESEVAVSVSDFKSNGLELPSSQQKLIRHMQESREIIIPASIELSIEWDRIDAIKKAYRKREEFETPSSLSVICWAVSRAMHDFEKFRWKVNREGIVTRSEKSLIGIALTGDEDTLDTPVLDLDAERNLEQVNTQLRNIMRGSGQIIGGYHSLAISDMSAFQVLRAQPVVIYPSVATLFIGAPYSIANYTNQKQRLSNCTLAFDHRVINGAYAARFMKRIAYLIRALTSQVVTNTERSDDDGNKIAA